MSNGLTRRSFLKRSALAAPVSVVAGSYEESALLRAAEPDAAFAPLSGPPRHFPTGRIGSVEISRLICGGNLISGFAHSRDLIYVSRWLKEYFTDEKVWETLARCEAQGVNTAILRLDDDTLRILDGYRKRGGKIQWLCQAKINEDDLRTEPLKAVDHGAIGVYVHGGVGDSFVEKGLVGLIGEAVEFIKERKVIAGVAGHMVEVPMACEAAGVNPDFYLKTYNSKQYWSAGPMPRHDSVWAETPEKTRAFMQEVEKPWIAYKVLGAGAIHPEQGFPYAYQSGADFICAGMFDWQIEEDVRIAKTAVEGARRRTRDWYA